MVVKFGLDMSKLPKAVAASSEPIVRFFSYHDAHPIALGMVLMEKFGKIEWLEWEPDVLYGEIIRSFSATSVSENNWYKIQAYRTLFLVDSPWRDFAVFENIILALNNVVPDPDVVQQCSVAQLFAGIDIMSQIREEPFDSEVCGYMAACALDEGVTWLPDPMSCALETLQQPMYKCKDCQQIAPFDGTITKDKRCDYCCERFTHGKEFDGKPNPKLPSECGKNIEVFLKRPPGKIPERFEELKDKDEADLNEEDSEDVQVGKLVVAHKYMLQRREQLVEQLEELKSWVTH